MNTPVNSTSSTIMTPEPTNLPWIAPQLSQMSLEETLLGGSFASDGTGADAVVPSGG
jgi:hypothetical protein